MILCPICRTIPRCDGVDGPMGIYFCLCGRLRLMDDDITSRQVWEFSRLPEFGSYPSLVVRHGESLRTIPSLREPEEAVDEALASEVVESQILAARASEVLES